MGSLLLERNARGGTDIVLPSKINLLNIKLSPGTRFSARTFHILSLHPCERGLLVLSGRREPLKQLLSGCSGYQAGARQWAKASQ